MFFCGCVIDPRMEVKKKEVEEEDDDEEQKHRNNIQSVIVQYPL